MIYIENLSKITDVKYKVGYAHFNPFDKIDGLNKIKEELQKTGILIETNSKKEDKKGMEALLFYNPKTKEVFWEYKDIPKDKENELQDRVDALEKSNGEMMALITTLSMPKM